MALSQDENSATRPPVRRADAVAAFTSSPDRTVFTEADNPDGWLSTDHTVDVEE